jgi:hypothetical protein
LRSQFFRPLRNAAAEHVAVVEELAPWVVDARWRDRRAHPDLPLVPHLVPDPAEWLSGQTLLSAQASLAISAPMAFIISATVSTTVVFTIASVTMS